MLTIYVNLAIACFTIGLGLLHKRLSERPISVLDLIPDKKRIDHSDLKPRA